MGSLDIDLNSLGRGKEGRKPPVGVKIGDLTAADILGLRDMNSEKLSQPQTLKTIRNQHHTLAMLTAAGKRYQEISQITGYSPVYISTIQHDPAFKELVSYYKSMTLEQFKEAQASLFERLNTISMAAAEELMARLEEKPEDFTNREIMEAIEITADRTGFGPQTKNTQVNINVNLAARLQKARERSGLAISPPATASPGGSHSTPEVVLAPTEFKEVK